MTAQVTMLTDEAVQESAHAYGDANDTYDGEVQAYIDGARFARDRYEARLAEDAKVRAQLVVSLEQARAWVRGDDEPKILLSRIDAALAAAKERG